MRKLFKSVNGVVLACAFAMSANATPLIDFGSSSDSFVWYGNSSGCGAGCTLGYQFTLTGDVTIDGLGVFDDLADGLNNSHQVGVWSTDGSLLASTTVLAGAVGSDASASGIGGYAYSDITALTLGAGSYIAGALFSRGDTDRVIFNAGGIFSNDVNASYNGSAWINNAIFQLPTNLLGAEDRYFGPGLRVATAVPEPSTIALLALGLLGLGLARRKRT